jgi:uncharacterized Ntn-hydrolase superfamily protein
MKKFIIILIFLFSIINNLKAQDTFSICAVDPVTGEVGSAGASCIGNSVIISDVHPGHGVIHTQSYYIAQNQTYARILMDMHLSPQAIIDSLVLHDAQNNPTVRQYGIVDLINGGRSAAYTGVNCLDYKNHITRPTYSIQGNILLGQQILDSMESRFLNTTGPLSKKLMAALQGAKVIGADMRCASNNTSSLSAFIRVARPEDTLGVIYMDLQVPITSFGRDPIDSLQVLYDNFITSVRIISNEIPDKFFLQQNFPNPFNPSTVIRYRLEVNSFATLKIYDVLGNEISTLVNEKQNAGTYEVEWQAKDLPSGIYFYRLKAGNFSETKRMILLN